MLNIVAGLNNTNIFKTSNYFRVNLGLAATVDNNGKRDYNTNDSFSSHYNSAYKTIIYAMGNIGDIKFYTDHYIKNDKVAVYYGENFEEFIYEIDHKLIKEKGVNFYLGRLLKLTEEEFEKRKENEELKKIEKAKKGNAETITKNPGQVTYDDLKEYLKQKRKNRYNH